VVRTGGMMTQHFRGARGGQYFPRCIAPPAR
jgi:hypothetical protein